MTNARYLQWLHTRLVQPASIVSLNGANPFTWATETYPYLVPAGKAVLLTHASFSSKLRAADRVSYFVVKNLFTVQSDFPRQDFSPGIVVPAGGVIDADLINNNSEAQWMSAILCGFEITLDLEHTWRDAWRHLPTVSSAT